MPYLPLHTKDNRCKIAELFARINAKRAMFRLLPESARKADSRYSPRQAQYFTMRASRFVR